MNLEKADAEFTCISRHVDKLFNRLNSLGHEGYSNYQRKANYKTKFKKTFINYKRRGDKFKQIKGELGESTFFLNLIGIKLLRELEQKDIHIKFKTDELTQLKSDYKDLEKRLENKPDLQRIHFLEKEISKHIQKEKDIDKQLEELNEVNNKLESKVEFLTDELLSKLKVFLNQPLPKQEEPPLPEDDASQREEFMIDIEDGRMSDSMKCLKNKQVVWEKWCKEHPSLIFGHWRRYNGSIIITRTLENDFQHSYWWEKEIYRECDGDFETYIDESEFTNQSSS